MTLPEPQKDIPTHNQSELLLRASRRALFILLLMILALGATLLGRAVWPDSLLATWSARLPWLLPVLIVLLMITMRLSTRGRAWDPKSPEVKRILQDEFRRTNFLRAQRGALIVVMALQLPLGLLFGHLPGMRAVMAMGVTTVTVGVAALIALFLFFDRE
jgi:hypothetical protein